jgi:hypothetical protein
LYVINFVFRRSKEYHWDPYLVIKKYKQTNATHIDVVAPSSGKSCNFVPNADNGGCVGVLFVD